MLSFIPVTLDLYRTVRRHLHWTLQNLVAFADRTGRCFPSVRTLAAATGTAQEHGVPPLAQLAEEGVIAASGALAAAMPTRSRPGFCRPCEGCPTSAKRVSHQREQKNRQIRKQGTRERDSQLGMTDGDLPDSPTAGRRGWSWSRAAVLAGRLGAAT